MYFLVKGFCETDGWEKLEGGYTVSKATTLEHTSPETHGDFI